MKKKVKVFKSSAEKIECAATGLKLINADITKHNSRSFWKLPDGKFLSKSSEAMKKYLDEQFENSVEHEGRNLDSDGSENHRERYLELCKKEGLEPKI